MDAHEVDEPTICFICRRPLTGEGHGLDASLGWWVHVRCHGIVNLRRQGLLLSLFRQAEASRRWGTGRSLPSGDGWQPHHLIPGLESARPLPAVLSGRQAMPLEPEMPDDRLVRSEEALCLPR
jgi:hypothetical protein